MSAGLNEVSMEAMEEVGVCRDRILDLVERKRRRTRCGMWMERFGSEKGSRGMVMCWAIESSPLSMSRIAG